MQIINWGFNTGNYGLNTADYGLYIINYGFGMDGAFAENEALTGAVEKMAVRVRSSEFKVKSPEVSGGVKGNWLRSGGNGFVFYKSAKRKMLTGCGGFCPIPPCIYIDKIGESKIKLKS